MKPDHALSFAVLPLQNASGSGGEAYVAAALTDYLTTDLSRIRDSVVIARASAAAVAATTAPKVAADRLAVRYVLHGTAALLAGDVQVSLALFDAATAQDLWTARFVEPISQLSALRSAIVARVAAGSGAEAVAPPRPAPSAPADAEAVDLRLRAKALLLRPQTTETMEEARRALDAALLRDPHSADAMTGLASIYLAAALGGGSSAPRQALALAKRLVGAALAQDPGDARAQSLRGAMLRLEGKPAPALAAYRAAIAADHNLAEAYGEIGRLEIDLGRAGDAMAPIERALRLSPLDPQRSLWLSFAGMALLYAGQPAEAVPWLEKSAAANPRLVNPQIWLAAALQMTGKDAQAKSAVQAVQRLSPGMTVTRIERQLGDAASRQQLSPILDALRRAGLPD